MIRLVATDLDGTLLGREGRVSPRTRAALALARTAGIIVTAATGRPGRVVRRLTAGSGLAGVAVCANGAEVFDVDTGTVIDHTPLAADAVLGVVDRLRAALPHVAFAWEDSHGHSHDAGWNRPPLAPLEPVPVPPFEELPLEVGDPAALVRQPVSKLLVRHHGLERGELAEHVENATGHGLTLTWARGDIVEVLAAGVTKASALARLCQRLGIGAAEVVAVGDGDNDLAMLAWAGRAVAVANASPRMLDAADEVTRRHDEDGVALVLERLAATRLGAGPRR